VQQPETINIEVPSAARSFVWIESFYSLMIQQAGHMTLSSLSHDTLSHGALWPIVSAQEIFSEVRNIWFGFGQLRSEMRR